MKKTRFDKPIAKHLVLIAIACTFWLTTPGIHSSVAAAQDKKLTVYVAKKVLTMDATNPEATAVAVRGNRIVAVGSMADLGPWLEAYPHRLDLTFTDKVLMPGLIDPHLHPMLGAIQLQVDWVTPERWVLHDAVVEAVTSPAKFSERLNRLIEENSDTTKLYIVWGWSEPYHGPLSRADLDNIAPDRPVMILQRSVHEAVFNTRALEMLELSEEQVKSHPQADQVNWERAHFIEGGLFDIVLPLLAPVLFAPEFIDPGFARNTDYLRSRGVTTAGDMATGAINWDLELSALQRNIVDKKVPLRVVLVPDAFAMLPQKGGHEGAFDFIDQQVNRSDLPHPLVGGKRIKLLADGAMFSLLMALGAPGYVGFGQNEWITPKDEFRKLAKKYWNEGYKIHVHSNGDKGVDFVLDVFSELQFDKPRQKNSLTIEHYGYANERLNRRVAEFGAAVSANPYYLTFLADLYSTVGLGPDRARRITPLRGLVDRGVLVALHSDFGMAPADPLALAWSAITRTTLSGKQMQPPSGLTLDEALRAITVDAAHVLGLEKDIGTIEAGKLADFAVLEEDPYAVSIQELKDIKVWGVVFEGEVHPGPGVN